MKQYYFTLLLVRLVLPAGLLLSLALRPFGLSLFYLLLYLIAPLVRLPGTRPVKSSGLGFLVLTVIVSSILLLLHAVWHSALAIFEPYGSILETYPIIEQIGHNLGLVSYARIDVLMAVHYLAPEMIMFAVSLVVHIVVSKLVRTPTEQSLHHSSRHQRFPMLTSAGKYVCLFLLMFSGILLPSATSGVYFLVFMGAATAWAIGQPLEKGFAVVSRCLMAFMAVHVIVLMVYQSSWIIALCPPDYEYSRYIGLSQLVNINDTMTTSFQYVGGHWGIPLSPLVILITYFVLAIEAGELFKPKATKKSALTGIESGKSNGTLRRSLSIRHSGRWARDRWKSVTRKSQVAYSYINSSALRGGSSTERTPLIRDSMRKGSISGRSGLRSLHQDSTGSVVVPDEDYSSQYEESDIMGDIANAIVDLFQVLVRSSYIATTITMMAWSIMFHSWLTFVLLMWANIVWLRQDQRSFMLKSSPVLVFYAMFLLLSQYLFGINLNENELPSNIKEVNLRQIGFGRTDGDPCVTLLIKSLFTCMFWVTLRQRVQELRLRRQSAVISNMAAPLQLTVSTAASLFDRKQGDDGRSRLLVSVGECLRSLCARYWIYVVVIMLFVIGVTGGDRMTIFRIIYMFLFLAFILMFQISWYWWRRLMYVFWVTLIIYSMLNLNLIYLYQFDNFAQIIETYLLINKKLQHDLGLDTYPPADLFVKLLTPTLFLIITIMQVHYFHKDFMALSADKPSSENEADTSKQSQGNVSTAKDEIPPLPSENENVIEADLKSETEADQSFGASSRNTPAKQSLYRKSSAATMERPSITFRAMIGKTFACVQLALSMWRERIFDYLDIHLVKIVFIALMLLSVLNVCAMHVPIMVIIAPALLLSTSKQRLVILCISTLISFYFMINMVYQIDYIEHTKLEVNCTIDNNTDVGLNNAEWFGLTKATHNNPLLEIVDGYIALIALITFYSLVRYRQAAIRARQDPEMKGNRLILFPEITRVEADKDIQHCIKYLVNYVFYKFGVEITLICLIGVIGSRMDVYALIYSIWLLVLVSLNRARQARVWLAFTIYITVLVPLQYVIAVGILPQFCVHYPWDGNSLQMKHIRSWLFLPHLIEPPQIIKLIFDYFLLLFATCQLKVFGIERKHGETYPGGSNSEDTNKDWETPQFVNPVPDFMSYVSSWLDIIKRTVFLGMLWVTLAIMFMTGTNRVNLFSMGYLIGSFIFLWQGTDFYLRPKVVILKWWSWLLRYNVCVVAVKALLQIPGCIFITVLQDHACWLVQLLGIGCVDKFAGGNIAKFFKMDYSKETTCSVPQEDIGLAWDGVCFAFLIIQRRLFHSYYFYRIIDESKATTILASRGADLIESLRLKQMLIQEDLEMKILEKIKVKMERIKANQKKIQGAISKEPLHHDAKEDEDEDDTQPQSEAPSERRDSSASRRGFHTPDSPASPRGFHTPLSERSAPPTPPPAPITIRRRHTVASPSLQHTSIISQSSRAEPHSHHTSRASPQYRPPSSHQKAIRSGDYYMFDEFDDTEVFVKDDKSDSDEDMPKQMGFGKLLATAIKTDLKRAVSLRRASMPAVKVSRRASLASYPHSFPMHEARRDREPGSTKDFLPTKQEPVLVSDIDDFAPIDEKETWMDKLQYLAETVWALISSILVSLTRHLMKYSRDYRYVSRTLSVEKKILKEKEGFGIGLREGSQMIWEPGPESLNNRKLSDISLPEIRILAPSMERGLDASPDSQRANSPLSVASDDTSEHESAFSLQTTESKVVSALEERDDSLFRQERSPFVLLAFALWYAVLAHTDIVCYIMVFINQIQSATLLSIPLPLMVFLWGTLTIPRPTKTFWVTLIAYTEVIVLIKSMFQFEILPWNQKAIPENMPFTAPRIIGIERKFNYALYDLLLLLIIFFHRFMLKSLGLWKESVPDTSLRGDLEYPLSKEDQEMLVEGKLHEVGRKYLALHEKTGPAFEDPNNGVTTNVSEDDSEGEKELVEWANLDQEPGPSRERDVGHRNLSDNDDEPVIEVTSTRENRYEHYPHVAMLAVKRYLGPTKHFFQRMLAPGARVTADIYAYMFLCDFFNFLVVIFGFAAFGTHQGDGGVQTYLEENKVPIPFLVMLILQFALIVIDRALYLRKYILGKILFQYALIIGVHIWMFFVLPFITERTFNALLPPPMWYMVKCIYLLLSAYQIRCGYPRRIIGNFLCKSYRFLNMVFYRGFMAVPFVFELRTLMDWIWTDTSMNLMDWLKMEDIFASVFILKCSRYMEDEFPQPRGVKKRNSSKYLLGGVVLAFVIAIIWFPLVFFAFGNSVGEPNPPTDVTVKIRIGPFLPVYQMSAQSHNIDIFTEQDYNKLSNLYVRDRNVQTFLSNYMYNDVAVVTINPNSTMKWEISPPELERLEREAMSNATITVQFKFVITHPTNAVPNPPTIDDHREVPLHAYLDGKRNPERDKLLGLLAGTAAADTWLNVKTLFPKFLKVFNKGTAKPAYQLIPESNDGDINLRLYRDVQLRLERTNDSMYWRVREFCKSGDKLLSIPLNNCDSLVMYTFNDKLFPETLNFISGSGIIGLYTTFVFLASRVLRGFFSGIYTKIMFDDLPNVDRVLQLCLDIYLVREALELALEEDLFAKLVFLYRSPETMIKWSRPKEESNEEQIALPPSR